MKKKVINFLALILGGIALYYLISNLIFRINYYGPLFWVSCISLFILLIVDKTDIKVPKIHIRTKNEKSSVSAGLIIVFVLTMLGIWILDITGQIIPGRKGIFIISALVIFGIYWFFVERTSQEE